MITARTLSLAAVLTVGSTLAAAQSYSSFNQTQGIFGVSVAQNGLAYTVSLDPNAYLVVGGTHYDITDIFGFWTLSATNALNGSGSSQNGWDWNSHSSAGAYTAGWKNDPKDHDIAPGGQLTFTYAALDQQNVEDFGFHFSTAQQFNGSNTAYFKGPMNPVPEPATWGVLAVGTTALLRRRRRGA